jgi:hypothetical protein
MPERFDGTISEQSRIVRAIETLADELGKIRAHLDRRLDRGAFAKTPEPIDEKVPEIQRNMPFVAPTPKHGIHQPHPALDCEKNWEESAVHKWDRKCRELEKEASEVEVKE